jgi:glycolate oxidase FAD binding subunit
MSFSVDILKIRDAADVEQAVRAALADEQPLEIIGHGSKRAVGHAVTSNAVLDLSALNAVAGYEPGELIITAGAAAPVADVQALLESKNQEFAFEPMDTAALLGTPPGRGTIGGMIAAGLAGPRRIKAGGARDHLLGALAVSGFGDSFKAGGKVVKNVTGYDLCKLLAGSWGTLAVMTEATLKVLPKAEDEITLALGGLEDEVAGRAMTAALGSPFDVSGAAHVPKAALGGELAALGHGDAVTLLRLEGITASVTHRAGTLETLLTSFGRATRLDADTSRAAWAWLRDVRAFAADGPHGARAVWRIVCPPAAGGALGARLAREHGALVSYDWGGGLIWAALPEQPDGVGQAAALRGLVAAAQGHAMLVRATDAARAAVEVFHPPAPGVAALSRRIKTSFDPKHILNRGRMAREGVS